MSPLRAAWLALLACLACAPLPEIEVGQCGNGVIEEAEDCDGFPAKIAGEHPAQCRAPGSVGACHLDCSRQSDGTQPECPAGWGCDASGICRRPTGAFESEREIEVGSATTLLTGDFDGDGRADVASLEPAEGVGITRVRFHYFDAQAQLAETRHFPLAVVAPVAADVSGDGLSDLLFSDSRIGLLRGRSDRNWVPDAFSSYRVYDSSIRTMSVFPGLVENTSAFVVFARLGGRDGVFAVNGDLNGMPHLVAEVPGPVESVVGDPAAGQLLEDPATYPCSQVLIAVRDQSSFWMYDFCTTRAGVAGPAWRAQAERRSVALDPPAGIDAPPLVADLNGDGHLDVLIGAAGITYAAYGDGQNLAPAVPYVVSPANAPGPIGNLPMPLAVWDVSSDGAPDFVLPSGVAVSSPAANGGGFDYANYAEHTAGFWSHALSADLNANQKWDFVAASSSHPGIDFFNGTASVNLTSFTIPTNRPVGQLVAGDFDGDQITDVAFTQISATTGVADSVYISFGASSGPPLAPSAVAQVNDIEQLSTFREGAIDHILVSSREQIGDRQRAALALLAGNGDRIPVASLDLTTFAEDGSTNSSAALRSALGGFLEPRHGDVLSLAFQRDAFDLLLADGLQAWLMPALAREGTPTRLAVDFDPELAPLSVGTLAAPLSLSVNSLDIDGDGRDEAVLAMPRKGGATCSVLLFQVEAERLQARGAWIVDEACARVEVRGLDADADGAPDLVLLTGASDGQSGSLSVFWNDGRGGFDAQHRSVLASDAPRAFATLPGTTARPRSIAYVNADGLYLVAATQQAREFEPAHLEVGRANCTGIVASDLNGDGATDLVYAAGGNLEVRKAILESR
jgi:hypothetical protein